MKVSVSRLDRATVAVLCVCLCRRSLARSSSSSSKMFMTIESDITVRFAMILRGGGSSTSTSYNPFSPRFAPSSRKPLQNSSSSSSSSSSSTGTGTTGNSYAEKEQKEENRINSAKEQMDAFLTRDSRNSFIARVYAILAVQLLITAGAVVLFGTNPDWTAWMLRPGIGVIVPALSLLLSTVAWIIMSVSTTARRVSPIKWQILALFTLGEAVSVGFVSSFYHFRSVVSAMLATALATTGVSLYTVYQTNAKFDLSQWGATLSSFGLIFVGYGLLSLLQTAGVLPANFLPYNEMAYGLIGATLFSCYLAYHTKLIVAGKNAKYQMNDKDYVFGAMTLYNDIINLFIYLLKVVGDDRRRD